LTTVSDLPAGRRQRADAVRSRTAVVDAAVAVLGRRPDASVEEIAAAAGVTRQTVYAHYPSRQALLAAVVDRITAEVTAALGEVDIRSGTAAEALERWVQRSWQLLQTYPVLLTPAVAAAAPAGDEYARHVPIVDSLLRLVRRGRRTGEFDTAYPATWYVAAIIGLGHAAGQEAAAGRLSRTAAGRAFADAALRACAGAPRAG
jgi:AcrR family transcriptional regulator